MLRLDGCGGLSFRRRRARHRSEWISKPGNTLTNPTACQVACSLRLFGILIFRSFSGKMVGVFDVGILSEGTLHQRGFIDSAGGRFCRRAEHSSPTRRKGAWRVWPLLLAEATAVETPSENVQMERRGIHTFLLTAADGT